MEQKMNKEVRSYAIQIKERRHFKKQRKKTGQKIFQSLWIYASLKESTLVLKTANTYKSIV
jgi:hypothetical protein